MIVFVLAFVAFVAFVHLMNVFVLAFVPVALAVDPPVKHCQCQQRLFRVYILRLSYSRRLVNVAMVMFSHCRPVYCLLVINYGYRHSRCLCLLLPSYDSLLGYGRPIYFGDPVSLPIRFPHSVFLHVL